MSSSELACVYASLILADDGIEITADKIATLIDTANVEVEKYWPSLFAKALEGKDVKDIISNIGSASGPAVAAPAATGGAAEESKEEEKEPEPEEESDDDMDGFSLFD
ncbi:60S acidic ribosomal protein P1 [Salpingoeca rosetta]|uniref:60S acidic ribosomal protein P1 n=1 Tax=Salpingoeca rosetta (strain ATCC 50818 / BSB-021) TaxID=946362 RepID=F2U5W8_SALR5|nr:60S acidic ribosomal protein P1 [Salpingoeca rosetta]EGD82909.1 60S acidic ribosomal protein P1 [Salpingoeca rosetta]|eukprot:XP_004995273.1 60S acidic ribosomal protein P1 [Salpingoeca rosetta]